MKLASFEAIVSAFKDADVRYLVAGGVAVNAHGYTRFTKDVDFIIDLDPDNILHALRALVSLGYKPIIPVKIEDFANADMREEWIEQKNMRVMQLFCDQHRETPIDIFVSIPFEFEHEYEKAYIDEIAPGLLVHFVRIETLIAMKEAVNRPRDIDDVQHLRWILEDQGK